MDELIPHRPPMQWIKVLTHCTDDLATATARFEAGDFPVANGVVLETALVELVAQTVAAATGQRARAGAGAAPGGSQNGMLVAVSNFKIQSRAPLGKDLHIEVRELKRLGPMILISGAVSCDGVAIASGELTLYA